MCDEIAIINHGEIAVQDSTKNLVGSMNAKTLVITSTTGGPKDIKLPKGVRMETRQDNALAFTYSRAAVKVEDILASVSAAGIAIRDIASEDPDLEDVFVALTSTRQA